MLIKTFVTLMLLTNIDKLFVKVLPREIVNNSELLNKSGLLKMTIDNNTCRKLVKRQFHRNNCMRLTAWPRSLLNLIINLWYFILQEVHVLWFNYFAAFSVLGL